ncbi:MAG: PEP-CTERM sorting domain-containing protein [Limnoraphis sp. WC205]|nr:PEP-CTERM sorting domain-containing protein [Limnoraphis sp. WC205]
MMSSLVTKPNKHTIDRIFPGKYWFMVATSLSLVTISVNSASAVSINFTVANPVPANSGDSGTINGVPNGWVAGGISNANSGTVANSFTFGLNGSLISSTPPATVLVSLPKSAFANYSISGTYTPNSSSEMLRGTLSANFKGANQAVSVSNIIGLPTVSANTSGTFSIEPFGTFDISPTPNTATATPIVSFVPSTDGGSFNIPIRRSAILTPGTNYSWSIDLRSRAQKGFGLGLAGSNAVAGYSFSDVFTVTVPEPLTILGSATVIAFGFATKREYSKKLKKLNQESDSLL